MIHTDIPRQNPFSLYDFIGYFIPGAAFFFLLTFFDYLSDKKLNLCDWFNNLAKLSTQSFLHSLIFLTFFFILSYILGHIISILSNIIIEKSNLCSHHNCLYFLYLTDNKNEILQRGNCAFDFLLCYIYVYEMIYKVFADDPRHKKRLDEIRIEIFKESVLKIFKEKYKVIKDDKNYFFCWIKTIIIFLIVFIITL